MKVLGLTVGGDPIVVVEAVDRDRLRSVDSGLAFLRSMIVDIGVPIAAEVVLPPPRRERATPAAPAARKAVCKTGECVICGQAFERRAPIQKTCSAACRKEKNRRYAKEVHHKKRQARKTEKGLTQAARKARLERMKLVARDMGM